MKTIIYLLLAVLFASILTMIVTCSDSEPDYSHGSLIEQTVSQVSGELPIRADEGLTLTGIEFNPAQNVLICDITVARTDSSWTAPKWMNERYCLKAFSEELYSAVEKSRTNISFLFTDSLTGQSEMVIRDYKQMSLKDIEKLSRTRVPVNVRIPK